MAGREQVGTGRSIHAAKWCEFTPVTVRRAVDHRGACAVMVPRHHGMGGRVADIQAQRR